MGKLSDKTCAPCNGGIEPLHQNQVNHFISQLNEHWQLNEQGGNVCVWLADEQGHHPDIAFGWGYCTVTLTTHDINALSENDFIWAAHLDGLIDRAAMPTFESSR